MRTEVAKPESVPGSARSPVGEIFAAWRVSPTSLMMLGWQHEHPAIEGAVSLQKTGAQAGRFVGTAWPVFVGRTRAYRFLAAVQLPGAEAQADDSLLLTGKRANDDSVMARLPPQFLDGVAFGAELSRAAPAGAASAIAKFLLNVFPPATVTASTNIRSMLKAFLEAAAQPDGCIEVLGGIKDQCVILQGWGRPHQPGGTVILADASLRSHIAQPASFQRADIAAPSSGQVLVLPGAITQEGRIEAVFLLGTDGIRCRSVLTTQRLLTQNDTAGHVRDMLPKLDCDEATRAILKAAARPRFEGRMTVYDGGHPVRISVDLAVASREAGIFLTGWLYDPAGLVESVHLRRGQVSFARLDQAWTRIPRPDVSDAFRADPALPPCDPGEHGHGFAVQSEEPAASLVDGAPYLELLFCDGWCGFLPLTLAPLKGEASRARLLANVDMHKPSGMTVIERQLAPFLSRIASPPFPLTAALPPVPAAWATLMTVPLQTASLPRALLAHFLNDPLAPHEGILFVCGENWTEAGVTALAKLSRFYGASAVIARTEGIANATLALRVAAGAPEAKQILLLGAGTVGRTPGWRAALEQVARDHGGTACVTPSVLYEDGSIQYAGCQGLEPLSDRPFLKLRRPLAGFPAGFAPSGPVLATGGVSAACCLIPRWLLDAVAGLPSPAVASWEPELDLLLQLGRMTPDCLWAPEIQVFAPEDPAPAEMAHCVDRIVARWCIRAALIEKEV